MDQETAAAIKVQAVIRRNITMSEMEKHGLPDAVHHMARDLAVAIAEQLNGKDFLMKLEN